MESLALPTWLIPLPPLLSFFLIVLFAHRSKALSHMIAIGMMAISWVLSWQVFFNTVGHEHFGEEVVHSAFAWLPFGTADKGLEPLSMGVLVDPLTAVMLFFVPLACLLIFLYSVGYHNFNKPRDAHDKPGWPAHNGVEPLYSRFFAFLSLFAFGMLTLVVADNMLLMFVGWEIMGLCSYLLIGFWFARDYEDPFQITPRQASVKAFMTTRIGDVFMLLGIAYLYFATGTLSFREIMFAHEGEILHKLAEAPSFIVGLHQSELIGILLVIGTIGKSAQFPLHVWLPDAMEGPTPVSAMIHAATMVSAGIYAIIRVFPILSAAPVAHGAEGEVHTLVLTAPMWLMAVAGSITAILGATIAVAQNDVKKVLAYSTISQLGFMMAVLGIGGYVAAAFHLMTHAFFKALLFLGSGSIIHGMEHGMHHSHEHIDPQDMRYMGGLSRKMPITFVTFVIGGAALAGFPFITAGFWSKDEILLDAFVHAPVIFGVLALSALLTAFYTTRQIVMTFLGNPRTEAAKHAHESHWTMTVPLMVLSFFAITAGWANIPDEFPVFGPLAHSLHIDAWFSHLVSHTLVEAPAHPEFTPIPLITSIVVGLGGILLGYLVYRNAYQKADDRDPVERMLGAFIYNALRHKYFIDTGKTKLAPGKYVDNLYQTLFVNPVVWLSENFTAAVLDRQLIDGLLHFIAGLAPRIGLAFRDYFDTPVINKLIGDGSAAVVQRVGREGRVIQTGRLQEYLLAVLAAIVFFAVVLIFSPKGP